MNVLNPFLVSTHFNTLKKNALENIVEKVKLLNMSNFTLFRNLFYAICI